MNKVIKGLIPYFILSLFGIGFALAIVVTYPDQRCADLKSEFVQKAKNPELNLYPGLHMDKKTMELCPSIDK